MLGIIGIGAAAQRSNMCFVGSYRVCIFPLSFDANFCSLFIYAIHKTKHGFLCGEKLLLLLYCDYSLLLKLGNHLYKLMYINTVSYYKHCMFAAVNHATIVNNYCLYLLLHITTVMYCRWQKYR